MGIFKKKKDEGEDVAAEEAPAPQLPPAPSATELALIGEREKSASAYKRASKAERSYRANKNAGRAREDFKSSKAHFKTALAEFKLGTKALFGAMKTSPALVQEKRAKADGSAETKRAKREEEKRKALAEKLKKAEEKAAAEAEAAA